MSEARASRGPTPRGALTYVGLLFMPRIAGQREAGAVGLHHLLEAHLDFIPQPTAPV